MQDSYVSKQMTDIIWEDYIKHFSTGTTVGSYKSDLEEFCSYMQKDFLLMQADDVKQFFNHIQKKVDSGELKSSTMAKKFHELHSIADFIKGNMDVYEVPTTFDDFFYPYLLQVAEVAKEAKTIPLEHVDLLFHAANDDMMAYTIMTLMFKTGLKSSEVTALKIKDLAEYDNGLFALIHTRKEACFISDDAAEMIKKYLEESDAERPKNQEYLFFNSKGKQLNAMYISRMMKKYCTSAGIPNYSANTLRASCAANMFVYDIPNKQVAQQMGVTQNHIARYKGKVYKDQMLSAANRTVKIKVELPK